MVLSLDTNVMIDLVNGSRPDVRLRYDQAVKSGETLVVSSLAVHEFIYGAMISNRPQIQLRTADEFLADLEVVDWSEQDAVAAASLRATLRRFGTSIGYTDMLIAGQALARKWTIVSANLRDFNRVQGLDVVDWTSRPTDVDPK